MKQFVIHWIKSFYYHFLNGKRIFDTEAYNRDAIFWMLAMFAVMLVVSYFLWFLTREVMLRVLYIIVDKTKSRLDDHLVNNKVFQSLAYLVPLMLMEYFLSIVFYQFSEYHAIFSKLVSLLIIFVTMISVNRSLRAMRDFIKEKDAYIDKPIQSLFQVAIIVATSIFSIILLSVLTDKSPAFFLTSLGAVSAIVILVFKDTILGFVGSIQLAANDMIRIGDWVTMDKYGADGNVEEINLVTVKVRNFDMTITTIPTYSFISDSFKNWRGMQESDGRRIKRAINLQIDSIQFASDELMERLSKIQLLSQFIEERQKEIDAYNQEHGFTGENEINARRQTNIGLFRRYVEYYLKNNVHINQKMTLLVRQMTPGATGVPIEIYCFTKTKEWNAFEAVQADIFDHIFAIVSLFELAIFENPTGNDFRGREMYK